MRLRLLLPTLALAFLPAFSQATHRHSAKRISKPATKAAPGGGPGMVWVNSRSNVYHCRTDRYYGKTKDGKYMTEAAAKAAGAHGVKNKSCGTR